MDLAASFRGQVAVAVQDDPVTYNEAMLGKPPAEYCTYIANPQIWGGGIELAVFAKRHRCEIAALDVRTKRALIFGEHSGYSKRIYLIYDGLHYDALHRREYGGGVTTVFDVTDEAAMASALKVTADAHASRQFTDTANFTLRCGACGKGIVGERDALAHARETGHTNFQEFSKN